MDGHLAKNSRNYSALTSPLRRYQGGTGSHLCVVALSRSCHSHQRTHPHQVVHGRGKGEHPADLRHAAIPSLAQQAHGLQPTEDRFHLFPFPLTDRVPWVSSRPAINGAGMPDRVLCHMRRDLQFAQVVDERLRLIVPIAAQRHSMLPGDLFGHGQRYLPLSGPRRLRQPGIDHQAMAVLHQDVARVPQLRLLPSRLLVQACLGICGRGVGGIRVSLSQEVDAGVAGIIGRLWQSRGSFPLEALLPGSRLNQGAFHGKVFIRQQLTLAGLGQDLREQRLRDVSDQQALPVFGKGRRIPDRVIDV